MVSKIVIILALCCVFMFLYIMTKLFSIVESLDNRVSELEEFISSETYQKNSPIDACTNQETQILSKTYSLDAETTQSKKRNRKISKIKADEFPTQQVNKNQVYENADRIARVVRDPSETYHVPKAASQLSYNKPTHSFTVQTEQPKNPVTVKTSSLTVEPETKPEIDRVDPLAGEPKNEPQLVMPDSLADEPTNEPQLVMPDSLVGEPTNNPEIERDVASVVESNVDVDTYTSPINMIDSLFGNKTSRETSINFLDHMKHMPIIEIEIPINSNTMFMKSSQTHSQPIPSSSKIEEINDTESDDYLKTEDVKQENREIEKNTDSLLDDELKNELLELEIN
jgi:hypothetical protein